MVVLGATNRPDMSTRPCCGAGRFDRHVYIGEPGREDRRRILEIHTRGKPIEGSAMEEVLAFTEGYGSAELERFVEALGTERTFTVDDAREAAGPDRRPRRREHARVRARGRSSARPLPRHGSSSTTRSVTEILDDLSTRAEGYVGSDLEALAREAGMYALRARASVITKKDFDEALAKVHPTMNENLRTYYGKIQQHFKGGLPKEAQPPEYQ